MHVFVFNHECIIYMYVYVHVYAGKFPSLLCAESIGRNVMCMYMHVPVLYNQVPLGTVVKDAATGTTLRDLTEEGEECVLAEGGEGGVGNAAFATANCRRSREYTEGCPGEEKEVELELKTIADVGMVSNRHDTCVAVYTCVYSVYCVYNIFASFHMHIMFLYSKSK